MASSERYKTAFRSTGTTERGRRDDSGHGPSGHDQGLSGDEGGAVSCGLVPAAVASCGALCGCRGDAPHGPPTIQRDEKSHPDSAPAASSANVLLLLSVVVVVVVVVAPNPATSLASSRMLRRAVLAALAFVATSSAKLSGRGVVWVL